MNRQRAEGTLEVHFYPGAVGPTIRIATHDKAALLIVKRLLMEAAQSEGYKRDLLTVPNVRATGIDELILTTVQRGQEQPKTLRRPAGDGKTAFG